MNDAIYMLMAEFKRAHNKDCTTLHLTKPLYRKLIENRSTAYNPGSVALKESFAGMDIRVIPQDDIYIGVT